MAYVEIENHCGHEGLKSSGNNSAHHAFDIRVVALAVAAYFPSSPRRSLLS